MIAMNINHQYTAIREMEQDNYYGLLRSFNTAWYELPIDGKQRLRSNFIVNNHRSKQNQLASTKRRGKSVS
jgi:hypothetical protein